MAKKLPVGGHAARQGTDLSWKTGRGAKGIDGDKGSDFSVRHARDPWAKNPPRNDEGLRSISARSAADDDVFMRSGVGIDGNEGVGILRQRAADEADSTNNPGTDIFDAVEGQSSDSGNRAVKSRSDD